MATSQKFGAFAIRAKVTSKGLVRDTAEDALEKLRGTGIPGMAPGLEGVRAYMRELRGYDEFDDNLA